MPPKIRIPAAFLSPAALLMVGTAGFFLTRKLPSDDDLEDTIYKTYPQATRMGLDGDARVQEFFRRVRDGDPREEERVWQVMRGGEYKGRPEGYHDLPDHRAEYEKERAKRVIEKTKAKEAAKEAKEKETGQANRSAAEEERPEKQTVEKVRKVVAQAEVNSSSASSSSSVSVAENGEATGGVKGDAEGEQGGGEVAPRRKWWRFW